MATSVPQTGVPARLLALVGLVVTGVAISACLGGITNAINGRISPIYLVRAMGLTNLEDLWQASIVRGTLAGICLGLIFSLLFATGVGIITRASCSYAFAVLHLFAIAAAAFVCWLLGGWVLMKLAALRPEIYEHTFHGVPKVGETLLSYAWVDGSIWGIELGGLLSVVSGLVVFHSNWRRLHRAESTNLSPQAPLHHKPRS